MKKEEFDFSSVKTQSIDFQQVIQTIRKAEKSLSSSILLKDSDHESSFTLAYESMLKISLALMLANGYRPRIQLGHHKTLVEFSRHILGDKFDEIVTTYDRMRRKRNKIVYDVKSVSQTEANEATGLAKEYINIVKQKMEKENPQLKLF